MGCGGSVMVKRALSGERVTIVSRKMSPNPCQLTPDGMDARYSRRKMRRTDSISKSAPEASVGLSKMWRMSEEGKDVRKAAVPVVMV